MTRIILSGGTGNQLFQYAAGRALALKRGTDLVVDRPTAKLTSVRRVYAMPRFNVITREASLFSSIYRKWALKNQFSFLFRGGVFYQDECDFFEHFFELSDGITLFDFFKTRGILSLFLISSMQS